MTIPCTQETSIRQISYTLERMEKSQERVIELLEKVASQDARIDNLEEHKDICAKNAETLFERMRAIELSHVESSLSINGMAELKDNIDKIMNFFRITTHKYAIWTYVVLVAMLCVGFALDIIYHSKALLAVLGIVKDVL